LFIAEKDIHWIREDFKLKNGERANYQVRIRYRQPLKEAVLIKETDGLYILFSENVAGISPGQFAAWYEADELIGSGIITH
jgi:tRNA-specific 2-thiouridylase